VSEKIKVTDKRMFTRDGELREAASTSTPESAVTGDSIAEPPKAVEEAEAAESGPKAPPAGSRAVRPPPQFMDLVGMLAEPVAVFLGEAKLPDGSSAENPELARFHIDLLEVLQKKTMGNLGSDEETMLNGLLHELRLRYIEKGK